MAKNQDKDQITNRKKSPITYFISRIELIHHNLDCPPELNYANAKYGYKFSADINIIKDESIVQVIINYEFSLDSHVLLYMEVSNDYKVNNLLDILVDDKISNANFTYYLIILSLNHARGIQSTIIKDSPISTLYMPHIGKDKVFSKTTQQVL